MSIPELQSDRVCACAHRTHTELVSEESNLTDDMQNMAILTSILPYLYKMHHTLLLIEFSFFVLIVKDRVW